jgi:hypothetical protein
MPPSRVILLGLFALLLGQSGIAAAEPQSTASELPPPKPVPVMQAVPQADSQASFQRDGRELARFHFGPSLNRPYIFPLVGPSGRSLIRIGHPHDPVTHSHHNGVWISHHDVNGIDFWSDRGKNLGRIVTRQIDEYTDADEAASSTALSHWINAAGETLLEERRRVTVEPLPNDEFLMTIDLGLAATASPVTFGKTPFGLVGVRMAKTIGVHDGGGRVRNSAGGVNEKGVFWKPAKWCDYSGPITSTATEGVTLLDHPDNSNHPTVFHVRDDGWMGTSLTFDGPRTLEKGEPLHLRYGLYVHSGQPSVEQLESRWREFSVTKPPETLKKSKK